MTVQEAQRRPVQRAPAPAPWLAAVSGAAADGAVEAFGLGRVRLLGGPFKNAQDRTTRYLRSLQPDRLLHPFRVNAGLPARAPAYESWESDPEWQDLRCQGHTLGDYLSASSMMWAATGDTELRRCADYVVRELRTCQHTAGSGLVCAFPDGDAQLRNGLAGRPVTGVPWVTMHKIAAGLRDAHVHAANTLALKVLVRLVDWIETAAEGCGDARFQQMLDVEHGGMNEVLADLAALTGQARHLALARRFTARRLLAPLAEGVDTLDAARTLETCGIHHIPRLARVLFRADSRAAHADGAERALVNRILAAQDPDRGMVSCLHSLRAGDAKLHCTPQGSSRCCTGIGMENHARYGESIFAAHGEVLYVTHYIACELAWREKGLRVSLVGAFPERSRVRLVIGAERSTAFTLRLRHPSWCRVMTVRVNDQPSQDSHEPGGWVDLAHTWRNGDTVDVELPMHLHLMPLPHANGIAAVMYGPMVLAARRVGDGTRPGDDLVARERGCGDLLERPAMVPRLALGDRPLHEVVRQVGGELRFRATGCDGEDIELVPCHLVAHEGCSLHVELA